jgi:hypothetical protein
LEINRIRATSPSDHTHTAALKTNFVYAHFSPLY